MKMFENGVLTEVEYTNWRNLCRRRPDL